MRYSVEVTNFIIRIDPLNDKLGGDYKIAVAAVCADGKTAILKGLSSDGSLERDHIRAAEQACASLGLKADWFRQREMKP